MVEYPSTDQNRNSRVRQSFNSHFKKGLKQAKSNNIELLRIPNINYDISLHVNQLE